MERAEYQQIFKKKQNDIEFMNILYHTKDHKILFDKINLLVDNMIENNLYENRENNRFVKYFHFFEIFELYFPLSCNYFSCDNNCIVKIVDILKKIIIHEKTTLSLNERQPLIDVSDYDNLDLCATVKDYLRLTIDSMGDINKLYYYYILCELIQTKNINFVIDVNLLNKVNNEKNILDDEKNILDDEKNILDDEKNILDDEKNILCERLKCAENEIDSLHEKMKQLLTENEDLKNSSDIHEPKRKKITE